MADTVEAYLYLAKDLALQCDWENAALAYGCAVLVEPSSPMLVQYGHMLKESGFAHHAVQAYRLAVDIDGADPDALLHLAHALKRVNALDEALSTFMVLGKIPNSFHVLPEIDGIKVQKTNGFTSEIATESLKKIDSLQQKLLQQHKQILEFVESLKASRQYPAVISQYAKIKSIVNSFSSWRAECKFLPESHLVIDDGMHRATTSRPVLRCELPMALKNRIRKSGLFKFSVQLTSPAPILDPVLMIELAAGWGKFQCVALKPTANSYYEETFRVDGKMLSLRLVPRHSKGEFAIEDPTLTPVKRSLKKLLASGIAGFRRKGSAQTSEGASLIDTQYKRWIELQDNSIRNFPEEASVLLALVLPVDSLDENILRSIKSVKDQSHAAWRLFLALDEGLDEKLSYDLAGICADDDRIEVLTFQHGSTLAQKLNVAAGKFDAGWIGYLWAGDRLDRTALERFAIFIETNPLYGAVYSDHDIIDYLGTRRSPKFKPDWNLDYIRSYDYIERSIFFAKSSLNVVGGYRDKFLGHETYDLVLRVSECGNLPIGHVPKILWHMFDIVEVPETSRVVTDHLERQSTGIRCFPGVATGTIRLEWPMPAVKPHVSILIPTRDGLTYLKKALSSILIKTDYDNFDVIIIDNGSREQNTLAYFSYIVSDDRVSVLKRDEDFNFAHLNNQAASYAKGEILVLFNNDVEVISGDWLDEMVPIALDPEVGCVGPMLLYPSGHIQHAGVFVGVGTVAGHGHKFRNRDDVGYMNRLVVQQSVTAVTAACLVVEKKKYWAVGGMDAVNLKVAFNDVDLCLKLASIGLRNVFTPWAKLYHYESVTRGLDIAGSRERRFKAEATFMTTKWGRTISVDQYYNPNLTFEYEDFSLNLKM